MPGRSGLLDSGYEGDASPPHAHAQRYVPPQAHSFGTHEIQDGRITSNFTINTEHWSERLRAKGCAKCYRKICSYLGSFCCITKTSAPCKSFIIFCWFAFTSLVIGLSVHLSNLRDQHDISLAVGDQLLVSNMLTSTFCESLTIASEETFSAHRVPKPPKLTQTRIFTYDIQYKEKYIRGTDYLFDTFRILEGSNITVEAYPDQSKLEFFLIAGNDNFERWKSNHHCDNCYRYYTAMFACWEDYCDPKSHTIDIQINQTDEYYFLFNNPFNKYETNTVRIDFNIHMNRSTYDLNSEVNCIQVSTCTLPLTSFTRQTVVLEYLHYDPRYSLSLVDVTCNQRIYMYFVLFCAIPGTLWIVITLLMLCICGKKISENRRILEGHTEGNELEESEENESSICADDRQRIMAAPSLSAYSCQNSSDDGSFHVPAALLNHI